MKGCTKHTSMPLRTRERPATEQAIEDGEPSIPGTKGSSGVVPRCPR